MFHRPWNARIRRAGLAALFGTSLAGCAQWDAHCRRPDEQLRPARMELPDVAPSDVIALTSDVSTTDPSPGTSRDRSAVSLVSHEVEAPRAAHGAVGLSLADLEQLALANNPAIHQSSSAARKLAGTRYQVGRYPNPTVGYFASQLADEGTDQHGVFIEQEIVRGNKLALNERVLDQANQVQLWNVESQRYRVLTDVRVRYYEALAAQRQTLLTYEFLDVLDRGVEIAEQRRAASEGTRIEVLQARVQRHEVDLVRQQTEFAFLGAWRDLAAIAGVPELQPSALVDELTQSAGPLDGEVTYQQLLASSPELNAARSRVAEARALIDRQQVQPVPNLMVQLGAGVDNGTGSGMINLQVGAPLPVHNDNSGNIAAAQAEYCRAVHEVRRLELAIRSRLARAMQEYDSALAAVTVLERDILPQALEALTLAEEAHAGGELEFLQVLVVRRTYFESKLRFAAVQGDLAQAKAKIDGLLLVGGLETPAEAERDDNLRGQTFSGQ